MNEGFAYSERIGPRDDGRPLLAYLALRYPHADEAGWRERIAEGRILVDGRRGGERDVLSLGQTVTWRRPPWREPDAPLAFEVLFEDARLLAVAKPSGLPTLPGGGYLEHTLLHQVRARFPDASPVHRLGRGTSGVVLFTRTPEARRAVVRAWTEHRVTKVYRALVDGEPAEDAFVVTAPIGPVPHPLLGRVHAHSPAGKPSESRVRVLDRRGGASLVEVAIVTGRPHQVRIHMAAAGHPLVGDPLFAPGGAFKSPSSLPGDTGYLLHAMLLSLDHPGDGRRLEIACPPPDPLNW